MIGVEPNLGIELPVAALSNGHALVPATRFVVRPVRVGGITSSHARVIACHRACCLFGLSCEYSAHPARGIDHFCDDPSLSLPDRLGIFC